ncbi:hypothetical protein ACQ4PT_067167 [Festuca glaucescens]
MYRRPPSHTQWPRWPDLPPDLLREISGHLLHVTNYIRFHAICRAWRSSHEPSTMKTQSLPWLIARSTNKDEPLNLRCVFSKKSYLAPPASVSEPWTNWVGSTDGATVRYFTALPHPMLHEPLVGGGVPTVMHASFPYVEGQWPDHGRGIVYRDGTILLHKNYHPNRVTAKFNAAILRPGDAMWTVVERTLESSGGGEFLATYHRGKILITADASLWHVLTPGATAYTEGTADMIVPRPCKVCDHKDYWYENSYILESHGELLWVTVTVRKEYRVKTCAFSLVYALSVSVYALQTAPDRTMRWVRKHGQSQLDDRVFFLGRPNSFAIDVSQLGSSSDGGCTYFMCYNYDESYERRWCVIRYNLVNDMTEIIEWLPQAWKNQRCTWLVLQPAMAPIKEIRERSMEAPKWKRLQNVTPVTPRSIIHTLKPSLQHCFRILVCNMPLTVNSSQLRHFFSKHGEVSSAKIICYNKAKTSQGRGIVTLATVHAHPADALPTLNGLVWDGYNLKVSLVNENRQWRPSPTRAAQQHIARSSWS